MDTGTRRQVFAWSLFGVLIAADAASAIAGGRKGTSWHGFLGTASTCAFTWGLLEGFLGPRARNKRYSLLRKRAAEMAAGYAEAAGDDPDSGEGCDVRRCG